MAVPLIALLLGGFLLLGMAAENYGRRTRVALIALTFIAPVLLYLFWA